MIKKPIAPNGLPRIQLTPREADVGQVKKLCAMRKITYVGWLECEAVELPIGHEDRISSDNGFTHEYVVSWRTLAPVPEAVCSLWAVYPTIMSWDIEVLSYNPKVFPSAMRVRDECFMIGVTFKRLGQITGIKHLILVFGPHDELPDTEVRRYDSELAVIFAFCDLINELNPDILLTYNGLTFDFKYLNRRLLNILEAWKPCGRILGRKPELVSLEWKSNAYGIQEIVYAAMDGRISIDMFPIIQRDFKLDKYTLDFCSFYFLKKNKAPVSPEDIFRYYKIAQGYSFPEIAEACRGSTTFPFLLEFRLHTDKAIQEVIEAYETHRGTEAVVEAVLSIYRKYQPTVMAVIGHYCVIDTVRPIELFEKLNTWVGLSELAQIVKVQLMDTFTRGQQIRVFSQLYDYIYEEGYYIDSRLPTNLPFVGGYVHKPVPGLYRDVVSFDFASLYPSIILAYNICYTTFVPEGSNVPDEMCNVIEWEEEGGEEASAPGEEAGEAGGVELEVDEDGNAIPKMTTKRKYRFRFIKADIHMGIFPKFLQQLLTKRRATRDIMENEVEYSFNWNILNARQGALKVSANSGYGFLGVRKSKLPLLEAALCVTAMGRMNIHKIMDAVIAEGGHQVYGDTDSAMIHFSNVTRENLYVYGREMARKLSLDLPKPMKIEFERAYASFFSVSAKRYACVVLQENGIPQPNEDKLYKRGIILARRDNCVLLRELYKAVLLCIVYERGADQALDQLMYYTNLLMSASVPLAKLIIIKSIAASYKSESNVMAVFGRRLKALGKNVQGGDRLEYLYCEAEEKLQGYKLALPEMVITEPEKYKLDRPYYFEKSFIKPIQQLLEIGFNFKKGYMKEIHKCILKKQMMCRQIAEMGEEARKKAEAGRVKLRIIRR